MTESPIIITSFVLDSDLKACHTATVWVGMEIRRNRSEREVLDLIYVCLCRGRRVVEEAGPVCPSNCHGEPLANNLLVVFTSD